MSTSDSKSKSKSYALANDGDVDVSFRGVKLAEESNRSHEGPHQNRWTEVYIYRTDGGTLVGWVLGISQWEGESTRSRVVTAETGAELAELLRDESGYLGQVCKDALDAAELDWARTIE